MIAGHPDDLAAAGQRPRPLGPAGGVQQRPDRERERDGADGGERQRHAELDEVHRTVLPRVTLRSAPMPRLTQLSRSIDGTGRRRHGRGQRDGAGHRAPARGRGRAGGGARPRRGTVWPPSRGEIDGGGRARRGHPGRPRGRRQRPTARSPRPRRLSAPIDILVNNAGVSIPAPIDQPGFDEAWATTMAINLTAYTRTIRAALARPPTATALDGS